MAPLSPKQQHMLRRILFAFAFYLIALVLDSGGILIMLFGEHASLYVEFVLFFISYLIAGHDVLRKAARNLVRGHVLDENFLMSVATIGAFALVLFPESDPHMAEGAAVMLFYQVGELFQGYAVGRSRQSIADLMDIVPDRANILETDSLTEVDPEDVPVGSTIVVKPGERVPLDGIVIKGTSQLDTAALTGESLPRSIREGEEIVSGCINLSSPLNIRTTKASEDSTVNRILELIENAADKKARTENLITRFARWYTPIVVSAAVALAVIPPLFFLGEWSDWILRALMFLVVSCPCALVISVPLSFFGGIGAASRQGILIKGANYLEALAHVDTVVFDKTGTLTSGTFDVVSIQPCNGSTCDSLLESAAYAEALSNHPIAASIRRAYGKRIDQNRISDVSEIPGQGILATVNNKRVTVGNEELMISQHISPSHQAAQGTVLHVTVDGAYQGCLTIEDSIKPSAREAISALRKVGVHKTIILSGDHAGVVKSVSKQLGIDEFHAKLLPQNKVEKVEALLNKEGRKRTLAFVGDGINDAPVLARADVGIAMGAFGSDAAIEAADVVLMDDDPSCIPRAIRIAKKTLHIAYENIALALGVKFLVLALATFGFANMWLAVFADVGVAVIAILNATRCLSTQ